MKLQRTPARTSHDNRAVRTICVGGFDTALVGRVELADLMVGDCFAARASSALSVPKLIFSSNGQGIALAGSDPSFARVMAQGDVIHADGMSVVYASRLTGFRLPERVATTDFFHDAARAASVAGLKFFMLGGTEDENRAAVEAIHHLYPSLNIVGRHHGYFEAHEDARVCRLVQESGADVLWVALGKPRQEHWCVRNKDRLAGIGWVKTCGGLYAFLSGRAPRAPMWMQALGMEWLHRALNEPRRLLWRYLTTNPYAMYRMLRYTRRGISSAEAETHR